MQDGKTISTLFTAWGTPVKIKPLVWLNFIGLWGLLSWLAGRRKPERSWPARLAVGALSFLTLLAADLGHALGHVVSARFAQAPMDEIMLTSDMPRTIYHDNDVSPRAHRTRALGGPAFNALGLAASLGLRALTPRDSLGRELVDLSMAGHGILLAGSLAPIPIVDGGVILKWTLVEQGRTPEEADHVVRKAGVTAGVAAASAGVVLATRRRWLPALGLLAGGAIALAAAWDKLR